MGDTLSSYDEVAGHDNFSDHSAVKCVLDVKITYANRTSLGRDNNCRSTWSKSSDDQLYAYKSILKDYLRNIIIPKEAVLCNNKMCKVHHKDICDYHDAIILCIINACKESIATAKHVNNNKTVPGWNDYVPSYFNASLFWHNMWVDNGRPHMGVVADMRHKTRAKCHHVCKIVLKMDAEFRCDMMAEAI